MGPQQPTFGYYGKQKRRINVRLIVIIVVIIVVLLTAIIVANTLLNRDSLGTRSQHLSAQLANFSAFTTDGTKNLQNGDLKKINAEISIINDGVNADLSSILPKKVDKSVAASESDASDTTSLANAVLAGTYDQEYKTVLGQKLEQTSALLTDMYNKTKSKTTQAALSRDYQNYQAVQTNLQKITL